MVELVLCCSYENSASIDNKAHFLSNLAVKIYSISHLFSFSQKKYHIFFANYLIIYNDKKKATFLYLFQAWLSLM
jgi:hypothetical protein